jgi:hypothetical protein
MTNAELEELSCGIAGPNTIAGPDLAAQEAAGTPVYRGPENPRQKILCQIFAEILRLPRVGIDDDFFALGGRSVDGVLVVSRANAELSCQLSFVDLFDAPTIAELDQLSSTP